MSCGFLRQLRGGAVFPLVMLALHPGFLSAQATKPPAASIMTPNGLRYYASTAYAENRLYKPAGNNALEYYLALRDALPADAGASSALTDLLPMTVIAAEQAIARGDFTEARRLVALIERADPAHPALLRMKEESSAPAEAAAAAAIAAADAAAANFDSRWVYVGESSGGGIVFVDRKTFSRTGSDVKAWWKLAYKSPQKDKTGDVYDEESHLSIFHCADREFSPLSFVQRLRGDVIFSHERKSYEISRVNVTPDSVSEVVFDTACGL